jgi:hypothetical protein
MSNKATAPGTGSAITRRRQLMWELRWISVETAGVAFGLYLMMGTGQSTAGGYALWCVVFTSFLVRLNHYARPAAPEPKQVRSGNGIPKEHAPASLPMEKKDDAGR